MHALIDGAPLTNCRAEHMNLKYLPTTTKPQHLTKSTIKNRCDNAPAIKNRASKKHGHDNAGNSILMAIHIINGYCNHKHAL